MIEYTELKNCRICKGKESPIKGYYYRTIGKQKVLVECSCHKKWVKENKTIYNLKKAGISTDYTFDDYKGNKSRDSLEALKVVAKYPKDFLDKMIYIYGTNNCQKTTMAQALGKELIKNGYKVKFDLMSNIASYVVKDFKMDEEVKNEYLNEVNSVDFLIIDEAFDRSKVAMYSTGYQISYLDNFIRNRFERNRKSIIFISNVLPSDIDSSGFGVSLQSLVVRNTEESFLEFKDLLTKGAVNSKGLFARTVKENENGR